MRLLEEYHHFRKEKIDPNDRMAKCERYVVDILLTSKVPDPERDSSICWELKHQATTLQLARILALKRRLPVDICAIGLLFHDINSIVHGKYRNHAHLGTPIAMEILRKLGGFSDDELDKIARVIRNHSDKHVWTTDPFQEIGKDADVLDTFLYEGAFDYYLGNKPLPVFKEYLKRVKNVWKELGLPLDPRFNLLDDYEPSWFQHVQTMQTEPMTSLLALLLELSDFRKDIGVCPPPFCILIEGSEGKFYARQQKWTNYIRDLTQLKDSVFNGKPKTLSLILKEILKENPDIKMVDQCHSLVEKEIISKENFEKATNILIGDRNPSDLRGHALLFWPLLDIYESLHGEGLIKRLEGLGVRLTKSVERE